MRTRTTLPAGSHNAAVPNSRAAGRLARVRRAAAELTPQAIEQIAIRVVQLLHHERPGQTGVFDAPTRLLTADEVARRLGVSRPWVYEHADELGARRLGEGPKARLRFDLNAVQAAGARPTGGESEGRPPSSAGEDAAGPARRRQPPPRPSTAGSVLVVRPRGQEPKRVT